MQPALSDCTRLLDTFLAGRNPRTLAAYQADLEDFRRFMETLSGSPPTVAKAVDWLLDGSAGLASVYASLYRSEMIKRGLPVTTINRRLASLRSLVKLANTHGLVPWTLSVENVPVQPYCDTGGPGCDGLLAMLAAAGAQSGPKGLRDVAKLQRNWRAVAFAPISGSRSRSNRPSRMTGSRRRAPISPLTKSVSVVGSTT